MSEGLQFVIDGVLIGVGATAVLDLWNALLKRLFGIPSLNLAMLGRWIGHLPRGRFVHDKIADSSPVPGELLIGWTAHYSIGVSFAILLLAVCGLNWARHPTPLPALVVGLVTVIAPFFILQPGMGAGIAASKTPNPNAARLKSIASHTVYGIGLYVAALVTALLCDPEGPLLTQTAALPQVFRTTKRPFQDRVLPTLKHGLRVTLIPCNTEGSMANLTITIDDELLKRARIRALEQGTSAAIRLTRRLKLSFWDALIVQAALESGCTRLLTEDLQHGQLIAGRLRVENPFLVSGSSR
jgi:DUF2938 family protein